jgi:hypothetical protein
MDGRGKARIHDLVDMEMGQYGITLQYTGTKILLYYVK